MRALVLGLVSLSIASALPLSGQAPSADAAAAVRAVQEFVNRNGTVTMGPADVRYTHRFRVRTIGECRINVEDVVDSEVIRMSSTTGLDLARLSPGLEILVLDEEADVHRLPLLTSSGDSTIRTGTVATTMFGDQRQSHDDFEFGLQFPGRAVAEEARQLLGRAIRECGGTPPTPEAQRKITAAHLHRAGNDAPTFPLKGVCRDRVAGLIGPGTPEFASDSSFTVARERNGRSLEINGRVQASGERRRFSCAFRREGDTYVPVGTPILN